MNSEPAARFSSRSIHQRPLFWLVLIFGLAAALSIWLSYFRSSSASSPAGIAAENVVSLQPLVAGHVPSIGPGEGQAGSLPLGGTDLPPQADLPESFYDFGRIAAASTVERAFYLTNTGEAPLEVLRAYTTCSCTTAEISSAIIPPGKSARIRITFDPAVHDVAGTTVRRGLILETNDPLQPILEIWVQASVRGD